MERPLVIVSDVHLSHAGSRETARALAALVEAHPGAELVVAGDAFGLSSDPAHRDPIESLLALLGTYPDLMGSLRRHLERDAPVTLIAGNHDAAIARPEVRSALLAQLELTEGAPLAIEPWFIRRNGVHVEHGHLWDPDNAPAHPLASWSSLTEPLGVALTRRFVSKYGVWQFAHAHETTLVSGIRRAFRLFGPKAPLLIALYLSSSGRLCLETLLDRGLTRERLLGSARLAEAARRAGLDEATLAALLGKAPRPTHTQFRSTFLRLYYDRIAAVLGAATGGLGFLLRPTPLRLSMALGSAAYLAWNVRRSGSRYQNMPVRRLRDGAQVVRELTAADLVVFGHTHVPESQPGYENAGSFGYPGTGPGRPFIVLERDGTPRPSRFPWNGSS
ncbi:MAG: metallophosphoesterase [Pseudomonadota bacterium]